MTYNQPNQVTCSQDDEGSRDSIDSNISDLLDLDDYRTLQNTVPSGLLEHVEKSAVDTTATLPTGMLVPSFEPGNVLQLPGPPALETTDVSKDEGEGQDSHEKIRDYTFKTEEEKQDPNYKEMREQNNLKVREWRARQKELAENKDQRLHLFETYFVQQGWTLPDPTTLGLPEGFGVEKFVASEKQLKQWKETYGEQWKI